MRPLYVILVDASGSMEPAWDTAWSIVFDVARGAPASFLILAFKSRAVDNVPLRCVHRYRGAIIYDIGCVLAERGVQRLRRRPEPGDVGIHFSSRTPINDAIVYAMQAVEKRGVPYEVHVISDNRDTASESTMEDVLAERSKAAHLQRIVLHCVGSCLRKYLDIYDEVVEHSHLAPPRPVFL